MLILFYTNRLIEDEERQWTDENVDLTALKHFPGIDKETAIGRPILFSNWLSKDYTPVDRERLREYTKARLKVGFDDFTRKVPAKMHLYMLNLSVAYIVSMDAN